MGGNDNARELIVRDYHANPEPPAEAQVTATLDELDALSDTELLDFTTLAKVFGYPIDGGGAGFRDELRAATARWQAFPGCSSPTSTCWCGRSGSLQGLLAASAERPAVGRGHRRRCGRATSAKDCRSWRSRRSPTG